MAPRPKPLYDSIGRGYSATRREDPRIARAIIKALDDARSVLDVGAGAGAYEPTDREVTAVEPSAVMIAQRPPGTAPVIRAEAEELPFDDDSFDAVLSVLSDHHWRNRARALRELRRVARRRIVLFNADPSQASRFWLTCEYLPGFFDLIPGRYRSHGAWAGELEAALGSLEMTTVAIPHDCMDGFYGAYWRRPQSYLDPLVREGISVFARLPAQEVAEAVIRLRADLDRGLWQARHADLLDESQLDLGYRVVTAHLRDEPQPPAF